MVLVPILIGMLMVLLEEHHNLVLFAPQQEVTEEVKVIVDGHMVVEEVLRLVEI